MARNRNPPPPPGPKKKNSAKQRTVDFDFDVQLEITLQGIHQQWNLLSLKGSQAILFITLILEMKEQLNLE